MNEKELIRRIRRHIGQNPRVAVGPGDDAAVVQLSDTGCLLTTDMLLDGVHFDSNVQSLELIGRKALAVNLSDIAAMAGVPICALVSLALPQKNGAEFAERVMAGINELCTQFGITVCGGDINGWNSGLVISITVLGVPGKHGKVALRSAARVGDAILVTGTLGGSIHGKHLGFIPRVSEAQHLNETYDLHGLMDLSDGLASDLHSLVEESKCGALLYREKIPITEIVLRSDDPLRHALCDGEDFELLFTLPQSDAAILLQRQPFPGCPVSLIGEITNERGIFFRNPFGVKQPMLWAGYEHKFN